MAATTPNPSPTLIVAAPPLLWAVHFVLCYGLLSIGCAAGWQAASFLGLDTIRALLLALTTLAAAILLVLLAHAWRAHRGRSGGSQQRFMAVVSAGLAVLSLTAVVWLGLAVIAIPPCQ